MVRVGLLAEKADIKYNPLLTTPEDLVNSIESLGFGASLIDTSDINDGKIELMVKYYSYNKIPYNRLFSKQKFS